MTGNTHTKAPGAHKDTAAQARTTLATDTHPGQDLRVHGRGRRHHVENLPGLAGARGGRSMCYRLSHERLARVEGGHEGTSLGHKAERCEGYTELHGRSAVYLSVFDEVGWWALPKRVRNQMEKASRAGSRG